MYFHMLFLRYVFTLLFSHSHMHLSMARRRVAISFSQCLVSPLCNCLVKKINQGTDVFAHRHTELPASPFSIVCSQARVYEINHILTGGTIR